MVVDKVLCPHLLSAPRGRHFKVGHPLAFVERPVSDLFGPYLELLNIGNKIVLLSAKNKVAVVIVELELVGGELRLHFLVARVISLACRTRASEDLQVQVEMVQVADSLGNVAA